MKQHIVIGLAALMATALLAADAKDEVKGAAKKLGDASGYSFKMNTESAGGGGGRMGGPTEGKTLKDGLVCLMMTRGDTTIEAFAKGGKAAVKTQDGWQSAEEIAQQGQGGGQGGRGGFVGRMVQNFKAPAVQAAELADKSKELKKDGDAYVGELTEDGAKAQMTFGRGGQGAPEISGAKGSVKFWVKDGVLTKYELKVQGKVSFNGNDRDVDRTTTVEIKDVGATKIEVPEDAKKKMS